MKHIFLCRIKNTPDENTCIYIEDTPQLLELDDAFVGVELHSAHYYWNVFLPYETVETVLTEQEYKALQEFATAIKEFGHGIVVGDKRHQNGIALCETVQPIYDKLCGEEGQAFFQHIVAEEKQAVMNRLKITQDEVDEAFQNYPFTYQDRSIIDYVVDGVAELGREEAYRVLGCPRNNFICETYFDFIRYGNDLLQIQAACKLKNGRCVRYSTQHTLETTRQMASRASNGLRYSEALEYIVSGADIAGGLEETHMIFPDSDMELTEFLVDTYNAWKTDEEKMENWISNIEKALILEFGV
jgi:hypothetical protein